MLVNPLSRPATFDMKMLSVSLSRPGIRRILGSQASDVNNGQPVTGSLRLEPFDAILLQADPIGCALSSGGVRLQGPGARAFGIALHPELAMTGCDYVIAGDRRRHRPVIPEQANG